MGSSPKTDGLLSIMDQGLVNVPFWELVSHHLQIFVGYYIPNSWVMFNWDICHHKWGFP